VDKKWIAFQTIVIFPIIIITSAWICSLQRVSDGVYFFIIVGGTFFIYEIFFNHYLLRRDTSSSISITTPTPAPPPPTSGSTTPDPAGVNVLSEIRDILRDSQEDADYTNLSMTAISLFAGLVAVSALLLTWAQISSTTGLTPDLQRVLGGFGNYIIDLELFLIVLVIICPLIPAILKYVRRRRRQNQRQHTP
jgi:hypothetical protein